ncbi:hypothetical protein FF38_05899 [Lucilia cuprina]|uniref:Uncharacterized protein n=1 Tax=Lucilia cuprina TaxID=7375 RepID=A0A0L0CPM9_LUCCU|nr:hypothetical protein FF38_05899 [Lucilia cuprina]
MLLSEQVQRSSVSIENLIFLQRLCCVLVSQSCVANNSNLVESHTSQLESHNYLSFMLIVTTICDTNNHCLEMFPTKQQLGILRGSKTTIETGDGLLSADCFYDTKKQQQKTLTSTARPLLKFMLYSQRSAQREQILHTKVGHRNRVMPVVKTHIRGKNF